MFALVLISCWDCFGFVTRNTILTLTTPIRMWLWAMPRTTKFSLFYLTTCLAPTPINLWNNHYENWRVWDRTGLTWASLKKPPGAPLKQLLQFPRAWILMADWPQNKTKMRNKWMVDLEVMTYLVRTSWPRDKYNSVRPSHSVSKYVHITFFCVIGTLITEVCEWCMWMTHFCDPSLWYWCHKLAIPLFQKDLVATRAPVFQNSSLLTWW